MTLEQVRFDESWGEAKTPGGGGAPALGDSAATAPGAVVFDFVRARKRADITFAAVVERLDPAAGWIEIPRDELSIRVAPPNDLENIDFAARMVVTKSGGWQRGSIYRARFSTTLAGESDDKALNGSITWRVQPRSDPLAPRSSGSEATHGSRFDSAAAASDTLGGRFPGGQNMLFHGAWTDPVTGFSYSRARWYDARTANWLSEDPIGPVDSSNLYAFVGWRPQSAVDPRGLQADRYTGMMREYAANPSRIEKDMIGAGLALTATAAMAAPGAAQSAFWWCIYRPGVCSLLAGDLLNPNPGDIIPPVAPSVRGAAALAEKSPLDQIADLGRLVESKAGGEAVDAGIEWGKGIQRQGGPWEDYLEASLGTENRLPPNFKTFDYFNDATGVATSAKTLDTATPARQVDPSRIYSTLRASIDAAAEFEYYALGQVEVAGGSITKPVVHVAVPESASDAHWQQILRAITYGDSVGVEVVVTVAK